MSTVVQHKTGNTSASQAFVDVTITSTGTGNLLVAGTGNNGTRTVSSVVAETTPGGGGDSLTQVPSAEGTDSAHKTDVWRLLSTTSGRTNVRITFSGAADTTNKEGWVWEVSGLTAPVNDGAANNSGTGSTTNTGPSVTTTSTDGFVVGVAVVTNSVTENPKSGNEFTSGGDISATADAGCSLISTTAASHTPVWLNSGTGSWCASTAAFKSTTVTLPTLPPYERGVM